VVVGNGSGVRVVASLGLATAQCKRLRHLVDTAGAERVTTTQSPYREHTAARGAEARYGNAGVIRTARMKTTARTQHGAEDALVKGEQGEQQSGHNFNNPGRARVAAGSGNENNGCRVW
jgi:hypothetical protein